MLPDSGTAPDLAIGARAQPWITARRQSHLPAIERIAARPDGIPGSIPLASGPQTVTFTLEGGYTPERWSPYAHELSATLSNVRVSNPESDIAEGLDTALPVSKPSGWQLESAAGWEGGDRITLGTGSRSFSMQVTGPGVLVFRTNYTGPFYENGSPISSISMTGLGYDGLGDRGYTLQFSDGTRSFAVPAAAHTLTWSSISGTNSVGQRTV